MTTQVAEQTPTTSTPPPAADPEAARYAELAKELEVADHGEGEAEPAPEPQAEPAAEVFGFMAGTVTRMGDIVRPVGEEWDAERD